MQNDPRSLLSTMSKDPSVTAHCRGNAKQLLIAIERLDESIVGYPYSRDTCALYDRLYRLEREAWKVIDSARYI